MVLARTAAVGESTSTAWASEGLRIWDSGDAVFVGVVVGEVSPKRKGRACLLGSIPWVELR